MKKTVKAYMFMTSDGKFITDIDEMDQIYFKKPSPRYNPFTYTIPMSKQKRNWKSTEVQITYTLPAPKTKKRV